jgi:hypothetical protein
MVDFTEIVEDEVEAWVQVQAPSKATPRCSPYPPAHVAAQRRADAIGRKMPASPATPPPTRAVIVSSIEQQVAVAVENAMVTAAGTQAPLEQLISDAVGEAVALAMTTAAPSCSGGGAGDGGSGSGSSSSGLQMARAKDALHATFTIQKFTKHVI